MARPRAGWNIARSALLAALITWAATLAVRVLLIRAGWLNPYSRPFAPGRFLPLLAPTFVWWACLDHALSRTRLRGSRPVAGMYGLVMVAPLLVLGWHAYDVLPARLLAWLMCWHAIAIGLVPASLVIWLVVRAAGRSSRESPPDPEPEPAAPALAFTRRSVLRGAVAIAPLVVTGGVSMAAVRRHGRFRIRHVRMSLPRLPSRLRGLTITQVSDMHLGQFFRREHLPALIDAVNRLDSDLLAVTGDLVDHSFDAMPEACGAVACMHGRYGRFVVAGNHDLIDSPERATAYLQTYAPGFLSDESVEIEIGGERIRIAGLFWSPHDRSQGSVPGHRERAAAALHGLGRDLFTIALAHHPHAFEPLADAGVDLALAGHTHGGQLLLAPIDVAPPIGVGSLRFRYLWGEYRRGHSVLYVTSGVGDWWPVRINAPAEIVQIQLV
jgi:predicted MPP superfamily phosphohydrolase